MTPDVIPVFGSTQPGNGHKVRLGLSYMAKKVVSKPARDLRQTMIAYLSPKIAAEYPSLSSLSDRYRKLGKDAGGYSLSTIQRVMSGDTGPSIDTLADIAHTLGCTVAEMLSAAPVVKDHQTHQKSPQLTPVHELRRRS